MNKKAALRIAITSEVILNFNNCMRGRAEALAGGERNVTNERFANEFRRCLMSAVFEAVDLYTQAWTSGGKRLSSQLQDKILKEGLEWWDYFLHRDFVRHYLARSKGIRQKKLSSVSVDNVIKLVEKSLSYVVRRMQDKIILRGLVSGSQPRTGPPLNPVKYTIATLKGMNPGITQRRICSKLDSMNDYKPGSVPLPESWQKLGERTWSFAWKNPSLNNRVKRYISGINPLHMPKRPVTKVTVSTLLT